MKSFHLALIALAAAIASAHSQSLLPGNYRGTNASSAGILLMVESNGEIHVAVGTVNSIVGSIHVVAAGTATNKPGGLVVARLSGRGRLRGHVSDDGRTVAGRVIILTGDRERVWFAHRFRLFLVEANDPAVSAAGR